MRVIEGDLTKIEKGVLMHQVNAKGKMGAGTALAMRKSFPQHYVDYVNTCADVNKTSDLLGEIVITKINPKLAIIGLFGQDRYGRDKCYTDYDALRNCLQQIAYLHSLNPAINYYIPFKMGCNLGGGLWSEVEKIIDEIAPFIIAVKK